MFEHAEFLHYGTIALSISINALGVGIGQGLTGKSALKAINAQPKARPEIIKTALLGITLIETAAISGGITAILLLRTIPKNYFSSLAELGIALAICIPGFVIGLVSAWPTESACMAVARQPFIASSISRLMTILLAFIQAPIIFGFLISLFISNQIAYTDSLFDSLRLISAGLCIGLGSIGPSIGLALFARNACQGTGLGTARVNPMFSFTFVSVPMIETPLIFALIIALLHLFAPNAYTDTIDGIALLAAALCISLSTIGTGIGTGIVSAAACKAIAYNPDSYNIISRTSIYGQVFIETCSLYAVIVSLSLRYLH